MGPLVEEWDTDLHSGDPLDFPGYAQALKDAPEESVRTGRTEHHVLIESRFDAFGGSMGVVAGERISRAFDRATELGLPVVCVTRSGGARMQEGMVALVQLGRTAAAARRHAEAGLLSIAVHRSPTTGGVLASYGSLCDLRAVEAGAVIGFAGPRVVAETTGEMVGEESHHGGHRARARPGRRGARARRRSTRGSRPRSGSGTTRSRRAPPGGRGRLRRGRRRRPVRLGRGGARPAGPTDLPASTSPPLCARRGPS